MQLYFHNLTSEIVGCFTHEKGKFRTGPGYNNYLPIVNEIEFKSTTNIKLAHVNTVDLDLHILDERNTNKQLNKNIKNEKKIDVTANDITTNEIELVFNFTDMNIVVYNRSNIPNMFVPLDNKVLKERYRGQLLFMTIYKLNNPHTVNDIYNNLISKKNYLKVLKDSTRFKNNINNKYEEFNKVIDFADQCWDEIFCSEQDYVSNSIKVITVSSLSVDLLTPGNSNSHSCIVISNKGLLVTRDTMFAYKENPYIHNEVDISEFKDKILPGSKFMYIVDNEDTLTDRYYTAFGETNKIKNIKNDQQHPPGLYIIKVDDNLLLTVENYIKLEDIDQCDFIYKTKEEAQRGADKLTILTQQNKENELNLQNNIIQAKIEHEKIINELKQEAERNKIEAQKRVKEEEEKLAEIKRKNEKAIMKLKRQYEKKSMKEKADYEKFHYKNKNYYEERSYERDELIEKIKLGAAICGVASAAFVVYKQLNK